MGLANTNGCYFSFFHLFQHAVNESFTFGLYHDGPQFRSQFQIIDQVPLRVEPDAVGGFGGGLYIQNVPARLVISWPVGPFSE